MKNLKILMFRSCNIGGPLPAYLGDMKTMKALDLSFNKLTGQIPSSFAGLANINYMFLSGNMLNGYVPNWLEGNNIDLSYNNFTITSREIDCEPQIGLNLFASTSGKNSSSVTCLTSAKCEKTYYSLHINCGGIRVRVDDATFDDDRSASGASSSYLSATNWAFSSTGYFRDEGSSRDHFILSNTSLLAMKDPQLYMNARISAITLTYYGFCLANGNYTVRLHFSEIVFSEDHTFSSLGRRLFDVYVQGMLVLKDFNIAMEAGGVGKAVVKEFAASVTSRSVEIRLAWAGKGTTEIPFPGIYGPLISAISVNHEFAHLQRHKSRSGNNISVSVVVVIVAAGLVFGVSLICGILWWRGFLRFGRQKTLEQDIKGVDLQATKFTWKQIRDSTNNFDTANKIGEGGFGAVYKGLLSNGTAVAIKKLSTHSKQGKRDFLNEIGIISALRHPNVVQLFGCCVEGNELFLVYEYLEHNSLAQALFGPEESQLDLDWPTRQKICLGIARGLAYLHETSGIQIVHRDIKATNVLLGADFLPKISDFGLAKLVEGDRSHMSTIASGTYGYIAPEYALRGHLTDKADVYSFGIVLLEIISRRSRSSCPTNEDGVYLIDWARRLRDEGRLLEAIDVTLRRFDAVELTTTIKVALLCSDYVAGNRPSMSLVVTMLVGDAPVPDVVPTSQTEDNSRLQQHFQAMVLGNVDSLASIDSDEITVAYD